MRISELASVVGVTTRAIRHYHHLGLLPEPDRLANGYRDYGLRHAVLLARIKRLTELGLGLPEVRDVLSDDAGRELAEVLAELDADLARQERRLREQRTRLGALLQEAERGELSPEGPMSPEFAALFRELANTDTGTEADTEADTEAAGTTREELVSSSSSSSPSSETATPAAAPTSPMAAKDREILGLLEVTAAPDDRERLLVAVREVAGTQEARVRAQRAYALLDQLEELGEGELDDPLVQQAADALVDCMRGTAMAGLAASAPPQDSARTFLDALYADFAPAQAEAVRRALAWFSDRAVDPGTEK
ncbi:MerR family transcriptional regulator [Streptomyces sp. NA04227]|uniref:MerR family transcriptional regulator n=1 Tax=Streptomyces sp. NA04227 TaxID=2742136 RepID=UPI00158FE6C9|nr:MerR family transcriptional regulator [Streptomyces sp. NA04227]QKW06222.1 MerR family transcriptional regulator [Streptomyces sp. NA04227]